MYMKINKKFLTLSLTVIIVLLLFMLYVFFNTKSTESSSVHCNEDCLTIHYIDVGQGDSTLVQFNNKTLLIDAGCPNKKVYNYLKKCGIKKLNYVIATHPHRSEERRV